MTIEVEIDKHDWYHAIDLGDGLVTPGRFSPGVPPNYTIFPVWRLLEDIDVTGLDCIDVGTTDGIVAFALKQEGAATVVATDRGDRPSFSLVRDHLGLDVPYLPGSTLDGSDIHRKLAAAGLPQKYDLVVLAGVIYHAYDPLIVLMQARRLLKRNGLIIVETVAHPGDEAALHFNPAADHPVAEPNTYFLPTLSALEAMLRFVACNPLASITNNRNRPGRVLQRGPAFDRMAVLARACRPTEIEDKSETLDLIIRDGGHYGPIKYKQLEGETHVSKIDYTGPRETWAIDRTAFDTRFELQPSSGR